MFTSRVNADVVLDLTAGGTGTINGAIFSTTDQQPTGSGVIHSFVRISSNQTVEQGYNTDGRPLQFDENSSHTFTRSLPKADLVTVSIGGNDYYKFLLDINQQDANPLLSLNEVEIYLGDAPDLLGYSPDHSAGGTGFGSHSTFVYDLDLATSDNRIELNYTLNSGSGSGDMYMFVRKNLFNGPKQWIYLYSKFGDPNGNNDGYEEWAAVVGPNTPSGVPLPASLWGGLTLLGALGAAKIRSRRQPA
ncbi:MAG TPA: hypothetical protein VGP99_12100 [Tepidisphaeraceae bacterium]|nr:hypothetical protein [Tepidisphaeraceae bacterium]